MPMPAPTASPRRAFAAEISRPEPEINLARAALLVAKEEYPQLSVEQYLARLDQLAEEVRDRLDDETAPLVLLDEMGTTLYRRHGFGGNRKAYYDPRNSFLNDVLDRELGIPLTLGLVFLEVGWRLGLPLEGVNFPSHFLVRYAGDVVRLLIDPFDGGSLRFEDEAQELLDRSYGGMVKVQDSFLRAANRRDMLVRLNTNLKGVYTNVGDHARALAAVERTLLITPLSPTANRARGMLLVRLGRHEEAVEQLQAYLHVAPGSADAEHVQEMVDALKEGRSPLPEDTEDA